MIRCSLRLLKQNANPPKRSIPIELNPLTRWSRLLPKWRELPRDKPRLDQLTVGLEGCRSAFNATNSIRACLFFGTQEPPTFLTMDSWRGIAYAQARGGAAAPGEAPDAAEALSTAEQSIDENLASQDSQWADVALFGEENFLRTHNAEAPLVALENFTPRAESVFFRRFPHRALLVVGHENQGVSSRFLDGPAGEAADKATATDATKADTVIFIPQYGTISSINVVTSLGVALFYAFLDEHFPSSRSIVKRASSSGFPSASQSQQALAESLSRYQACFAAPVPAGPPGEMRVCERAMADPEGNHTPRLDVRPLHPSYFKKDVAEIRAAHDAFRVALLAYSNESLAEEAAAMGEAAPTVRRKRFGLSVLYENEYDQRNFGGLIRNANAFLVDTVCYLGKRRFNVVGSVGSHHYTPPVHLGPTFVETAEGASDNSGYAANAEYEAMIKSVIQEQAVNGKDGAKLTEHQERIVKLSLWSLRTRSRIEKACGGHTRFWLLDCGHRNLYADDFALLRQMQRDGVAMGPEDSKYKSSMESLVWYMTHCAEEDSVLSLCDSEEKLFAAAGDGVVLLVPQEGKLPHISLLMQCEKILTVVPDDFAKAGEDRDVALMRGLPSQVASGIALQRLSAVLHPGVKKL